MAADQEILLPITFGAAATPWEADALHGLNIAGTAVIPDKFDPVQVLVTLPGIGDVSLPTSCVTLTADVDRVYARLPDAGAFGVAPTAGAVWVHVERVHTINGDYDASGRFAGAPALPGGAGAVIPTTGTVYYVDTAVGNDTWRGTSLDPLATITAALALAVPGDVIRVAQGDYQGEGPLVMIPGVKIMGDGQAFVDTAEIVFPAACGGAWVEGIAAHVAGGLGDAALVDLSNDDGNVIYRCWLDGPDVGDYAINGIDANDLHVRGCLIDGIIQLVDSDSIQIAECDQAVDNPAAALFLNGCDDPRVIQNVITQEFDGPGAHGLVCDLGSSEIIQDNTIGVNTGIALYIVASANAREWGNYLYAQGGAGTAVQVDVGATLYMGASTYDLVDRNILGTAIPQVQDADTATGSINPANWVAAPPADLVATVDRMAAAVAGLLAAPIP